MQEKRVTKLGSLDISVKGINGLELVEEETVVP